MARTVNRTLIFLILCTLVLSAAPTARGAGCAKTCVSMHREGGELVITARRDPRPILRSSPTPIPSIAPSPSASLAPKKSAKRARPKFSDQIRELLPEGSFTLLPRRGALIHEPLLLRSFGCVDFAKRLPILDTSIELRLTPRIEWIWGDGQRDIWGVGAQRGAHIYSRAGKYLIQMRCQWSGLFRTPDSPWAPIPEGIFSTAVAQVELFRAQVFFTE